MNKWKCSICGYIHDEASDGAFAALPQGWVCPWCKAAKSAFAQEGTAPEATPAADRSALEGTETELSPLALSALCSNLAKGCEKQYLPEEAAQFTALADYFKRQEPAPEQGSMADLLTLVEQDLAETAPLVAEIASEHGDRGALRAYTWCVRVSTLLQSLLERYQEVGDAMLADTGVYVCTICGFVHIGSELPALCPVCKVPNYKFEEIKGEIKWRNYMQ